MGTAASALLKATIVGFAVYGVAETFIAPEVLPLRYFTIQSNIMAACLTAYLLFADLRGSTVPGSARYLRGAALLAISVTGIVYHALLVPPEGMSFQSHVLHTIVPVAFVADWLLFDRKGGFRLSHIPIWVAYPLAYVVVTLLLALVDGFYPYPFMDAAELGYGGVLINIIGLLMAFSLLGAVYVSLDRLLAEGIAFRHRQTG